MVRLCEGRRRRWRASVRLGAAALAVAAGGTEGAHAADVRWTAGAGNLLWKSTGNWNAGAMPGPGDVALFDTAGASGVIQLEGFTRTVDGVRFSNSFPESGHVIGGGTLRANFVRNDEYVNYPNNTIAANLEAVGTTLTLVANGGSMDLTGPVSATTLAVTATAPATGAVNLKNTANSLAAVTLDSSTVLNAWEPGSLGTSAVVTVADGMLALSTASTSATFGNSVNVTGTAVTIAGYAAGGGTVTAAHLGVAGNSFVTYETSEGGTLAFTAASLGGAATFATGGPSGWLKLGAVAETTAGSSLSVTRGNVQLNGVGSYTGGTSVYGSSTVALGAAGALGTGAAGVYADGVLRADAAQGSWPAVNVYGYGALVGDLTGAQYGGASRNIWLSENAIVGATAGAVPVRGADVDHAAYYLAVTGSGQVASVGEDGSTSVFKGVAFGTFTPGGVFSGHVSERVAGQGITAYVSPTAVTLHGARFDTTNTDTGVRFFGSGEVVIDAPLGPGSATVLSFEGNGDATTQGTFLADLMAGGVVGTGQTVNVSNGILFVGTANAVATGGTVRVKDGGTLLLWDEMTAVKPSTGVYQVEEGGAVYLNDPSLGLNGGATYQFAPGSLLVLAADANTSTPVGSPTAAGANVVVASAASWMDVTASGAGVVLRDGRRLTTGAYYDGWLSATTTVRAETAGSRVLLTAASGNTLRIDGDVLAAASDVQVGDAGTFTTVGNFTERQTVGQDGKVALRGSNVSARHVYVAAGDLTVGDAATDVATLTSLTHASPGVTTLAQGTISVGPMTVSAGQLAVQAKMQYASGASIAVDGGAIQFQSTLKPTVPVGGMTLTVAAGAAVTTTSADPFTDDNGTPANPSDDRSMDVVNNGTLTLGAGTKRLGALCGTGTTSLQPVMAVSTLSVNSVRQGSLAMGGWSVSIRPDGTAAGASRLGDLSMPGSSRLDIADNALVIDYAGTTVAGSVRGWLQTGRGSGYWNGMGAGIISSTAAADAQQRVGIGWAEASQLLGLSGSQTATYMGQAVDATSIVLKQAWYGDTNLSGTVDADDYARIDRGIAMGLSGWVNGDFDYSGTITSADYLLMDRVFVQQGGVLSAEFLAAREAQFGEAYASALIASVPEPGMAGMAAATGLGMLARRRRTTPARA